MEEEEETGNRESTTQWEDQVKRGLSQKLQKHLFIYLFISKKALLIDVFCYNIINLKCKAKVGTIFFLYQFLI